MLLEELKRAADFITEGYKAEIIGLNCETIIISLDKEKLLDFLVDNNKDLEKEGVNLNSYIRYRASVKYLNKLYSNLENYKNLRVKKGKIINYCPENTDIGFMNVEQYIEVIYDVMSLDKIISKEDFINKLGGEFFRKALEIDKRVLKLEGKKNKDKKEIRKGTKGVVYLLKIKGESKYKIGVSSNFKKRYNQLASKMPYKLLIVHKINSNNMYHLEKELHNRFKNKKIKGEWFNLEEKDIKYICSINKK